MENYIGIDLGGTAIKGGLIADDRIIRKEMFPIRKERSGEEIIDDICNLIRRLWDEDVMGIGFAVPALIDPGKGIIYGLTNIPQLNDVSLKQILEERFGIQVCLQNDANCFAWGEFKYGIAQGYKNIIGLITGTGVGAGIIIDKRLYNGSNWGAGEFGMIPYRDSNFESYCGGHFFTSYYGIPGEELAERAGNGDQEALTAFQEYGLNLGELIKLICYTLDPQIIVIGGSVSKSFSHYEVALKKSMESYFFKEGTRAVIRPSVNEDIAIIGAAELSRGK